MMAKKMYELNLPPFFQDYCDLDEENCLEDFISRKRVDEWKQIVLGIIVENYSKYDLKHPTFYNHCGQVRKIRQVHQLPAGEKDMYAFDNWADKTDICGSISWQLYDGYEALNVRLVLTFKMPWK